MSRLKRWSFHLEPQGRDEAHNTGLNRERESEDGKCYGPLGEPVTLAHVTLHGSVRAVQYPMRVCCGHPV